MASDPSPPAPALPAGDQAGRRRPRTFSPWIVLVLGIVCSAIAAAYWRADVRTHDRTAFRATAKDVSAAVASGLRRDVDLLITLRAVVTQEPNLTDTQFERLYREIHAGEYDPAQLATAIIEVVPRRELPRFAARVQADPPLGGGAAGGFSVVPQGSRPSYCLLSAWATPTARSRLTLSIPPTFDFCAPSAPGQPRSSLPAALQTPPPDGTLKVLTRQPAVAAGSSLLIGTAFYRAHALTATTAQRRAALRGWIGSSFNGPALLSRALDGHRGLGVRLALQVPDDARTLVARAGPALSGPFTYSKAVDIAGRFIVGVSGGPGAGAATLQAAAVFLGGSLTSMLAFLLLGRIVRSRDDALRRLRESDAELVRQALHDPLTGLPNRALVEQHLAEALTSARRRQTPMAMLLINVDGFSRVNAAFGRQIGDAVLGTIAARLAVTVRDTDVLARLDGDFFLVLCPPSSSDAAPELIAERILDVVRQPIELPATKLSLTASIGVAYGRDGSPQELERDAVVALGEAKASGKDRQVTFDSSMRGTAADRLLLETELHGALEAGQFVLLYRPGVDLRSGTVTGIETLVRWRHPRRGLLASDAFVDLAQETGEIAALDRWTLVEACRQAAAWERAGLSLICAINVSARQIERRGLVEELAEALEASGVTPSLVTLEIDEMALQRAPASGAALLESIAALGAEVIIDHFGTGYMSADQLRRLRIGAVKLDRSVVASATDPCGDDALVHALVQLAKELEMVVVAGGIETAAELEHMCRDGCDIGQGGLIAPALEADTVQAFVEDWPQSNPKFQAEHRRTLAALPPVGSTEALEVILVEDHLAVRKGIALLLGGEGMRVAGVAGRIDEARELLARRRHDVALVSLHLGTESAIPLVEEILEADPQAAIVLYTGTSSSAALEGAVRIGARGFVLKSSPPSRLLDALRSVAAGGAYVDPALAGLLCAESEVSRVSTLSSREREILALLAAGLTGQAIAERLFLSPETVKTHIRNATTKLGAKTRVQAVALMVRESHPA